MKTLYYLSVLAAVCILSGCSLFGLSNVDEPAYTTVRSEGTIELREYGELVVAETTVKADYDSASDRAFRRLFQYISGKNIPNQKIAMTAPVLMNNKENQLEELSPPLFREKTESGWKMGFVLPEQFTFENAPQPENELVTLREVPAKKVAAIRFTGRWNVEAFNQNSEALLSWLRNNNFKVLSAPRAAAFNPPWTLPFLRRNEVHIDVQ